MNRYPIGKPPRWWSPRPSVFWMRLWRWHRRRILRNEQRVTNVTTRGLEHVKRCIAAGQGLLIVANHPTHADWLTIYEALDLLRRRCYVMTTWQVFQMANRFTRMQYRQHGCFSVDRDGADRQAFRCSVEILAQGSDPLVIFPEGEVYHTADRVAPFRDGPATIGQAAVKRANRPVACVPCALKYTYVTSPLPELLDVMLRVERKLELPESPQLELIERIYRAGDAATARLERQHLGQSFSGEPLRERMPRLVRAMLDELDARYGIHTNRWSAAERIKQLRQQANARREELLQATNGNGAVAQHGSATTNGSASTGESSPAAQLESIERDLEQLFQALQVTSYTSNYLRANPTLERLAETIDKLEEDILGVSSATIRGTREATITFGEPVLVTEAGDRESAGVLTAELHGRLQQLVDQAGTK